MNATWCVGGGVGKHRGSVCGKNPQVGSAKPRRNDVRIVFFFWLLLKGFERTPTKKLPEQHHTAPTVNFLKGMAFCEISKVILTFTYQ